MSMNVRCRYIYKIKVYSCCLFIFVLMSMVVQMIVVLVLLMFASDTLAFCRSVRLSFFFKNIISLEVNQKESCDSLPNVNVPNDNGTAC